MPRRPEAWRPNVSVLDNPEAFGYKVFTRAYDEIVNAEELCDADELERLRAFLDKQLQTLAWRRGAARQSPAAPTAGPAESRLGLRSRRRHDRCRAAGPRHRRSDASPYLQAGAGDDVSRHRGHAAARQFGLHARASDHGRGLLRRHSRPHAGALRRQGRDPGLHHARLERRPRPRAMAELRQARAARPAQRPPPHHLQIGRRARGGARAAISG